MPVLVDGLREGFLGLGTRHCLSVLMSAWPPPGVEWKIRAAGGDAARLKIQS
jgi:hypothetical protein